MPFQIFDKYGRYLAKFGRAGKEDGCLWHPRKVAVLGNGHFVVCDRGVERSRMQVTIYHVIVSTKVFRIRHRYLSIQIDGELGGIKCRPIYHQSKMGIVESRKSWSIAKNILFSQAT